jgi:ABC-2 type transport system permease protein
MGILNNAYQNSSSSIISGKFSGDLQDLKVTPLNNHQIIWAMAFGGLTRGLIVGTITFLVGQIFYYIHFSNWMEIANPFEFVIFCILGGLIFGMLGISVAFWAKTFDQMSSVSSFVLTPLIYLGGVFFSLEILHPFWQGVSKYNPLLYIINGFRYGLLGQTDVSLGTAYLVSFISLILVYAIAWRSLQKAIFTRW